MLGLGQLGQDEAATGSAGGAELAIVFGEETGGEQHHLGVDDGDALAGDGLPDLRVRGKKEEKGGTRMVLSMEVETMRSSPLIQLHLSFARGAHGTLCWSPDLCGHLSYESGEVRKANRWRPHV